MQFFKYKISRSLLYSILVVIMLKRLIGPLFQGSSFFLDTLRLLNTNIHNNIADHRVSLKDYYLRFNPVRNHSIIEVGWKVLVTGSKNVTWEVY